MGPSANLPLGHRCIDEIMQHTVAERLRKKQMVVKYASKAGKVRFHGGGDLKKSQAYPGGSLEPKKYTCFCFSYVFILLKVVVQYVCILYMLYMKL